MKRNKNLKLLFVGVAMVFSCAANAQFDQIAQYNKILMQNWAGQYIRIGAYKVKGSPYLYGTSMPGEIMVAGENQYKKLDILYNIYEQKAGISTNGEFVDVDKGITSFLLTVPQKFGSGVLKFDEVGYFNPGKLKGYFNVLAEKQGKYSFLRYFSANLRPDPDNMMDKDVRVFDQNVDYYLYNAQTKKLKKVKLRSKDIEAFIPEAKGKGFDLSTISGITSLINAL